MAEPVVITPRGELDLAAVRGLAPELNAAAGQLEAPVVLDLSEVTFMDSTALGAVLQAHGRLQRSGRRLSVVAPPDGAAARLLDLTDVGGRLLLYRSRAAALGALATA